MKTLLLSLCLFMTSLSWAGGIGIISASQGPVRWYKGDDAVKLGRGDTIAEGSRVMTGERARLVARMNDGSVITLGANTTMEFTDWQFAEGSQANHAELTMVEGVFRFVTGLITDQPDPQLTVATPSASIGVRGTDFWGGYLDADALDVILLDGKHRLEISNAFGKTDILQPGLGVTVADGEKPGKPVKWGDEKLQRAVQSITLDAKP
ncbi:FecR family protein [Thalassolituus sp. LLYu03]|uniref:FecR family protein n=1 Tax=Thalassolituus sp. LLYu03 TaxID=3421656 RepID=UPI003D2AAB07